LRNTCACLQIFVRAYRGPEEMQTPWHATGTQPACLKRKSPQAMLILRLAANKKDIFISEKYIF